MRIWSRQREAGTVLITAMWVLLALAGMALALARAARVEVAASANTVAALQAESLARGGLRFVLAALAENATTAVDLSCEAVKVGDGYFWVLRNQLDDDSTRAFGITDEASRVNLNAAPEDMLLKLPGMTAELAAAIVDWRDSDSEVSPGGAESEYYLLLDEPYDCKNGRFETVDELLMVKGATETILFGEDANRNGVLDSNENDADQSAPEDNRDGRLDRGLYDYVTVYSREPNKTASGEDRVNVNSGDTSKLSTLLRGVVRSDRYFQMMDAVRSRRPFDNALDFYFDVGLTPEEFKQIADKLTTTNARTIEGRINVNTAPRAVLLCLPGLDESDADALVEKRSASGTDKTSLAWVVEALPKEKAVAIGGLITTRSYVFSADIVALSPRGRGWKRYRAVIDTRESPSRVVLWKDLTRLGWPLAPAILEAARQGEEITAENPLNLKGAL